MRRGILLSALIATGLMLTPALAQDKGGAMSPMSNDKMSSDKMKPTDAMSKSGDNMKKSDGMSDKKDAMKDGMKDTSKK